MTLRPASSAALCGLILLAHMHKTCILFGRLFEIHPARDDLFMFTQIISCVPSVSDIDELVMGHGVFSALACLCF